MASSIPLGYLLRDPATAPDARARVRAAIAAHGTLSGAAKALGISYRQLCRWRDEYGPDLVPVGTPGNPAFSANHDSNVIAKGAVSVNHDSNVIAETSQTVKTATSVSRSDGVRQPRKPRKRAFVKRTS